MQLARASNAERSMNVELEARRATRSDVALAVALVVSKQTCAQETSAERLQLARMHLVELKELLYAPGPGVPGGPVPARIQVFRFPRRLIIDYLHRVVSFA